MHLMFGVVAKMMQLIVNIVCAMDIIDKDQNICSVTNVGESLFTYYHYHYTTATNTNYINVFFVVVIDVYIIVIQVGVVISVTPGTN